MKLERLIELDFYKKIFRIFVLRLVKLIELIPARRPIWMACERGDDACDNGLWMFRYLQDNHPEIDSWYVITKDAPDRRNLVKYKGNVVTLPSMKFYWLLIRSHCLFTAHFRNYLSHIHTSRIHQYLAGIIAGSKKTIRLQHGITKDDMTWFVKGNCKTDLFICGAKPEYEFIKGKEFYPSQVLRYTGFARFDGLHDFQKDSKTILLMPTWRRYIRNVTDFTNSQYFKTYSSLLCNTQLHKLLNDNQYKLIFNIHPCFKNYIRFFKELSVPDCIIIADYENYDVQTLLKESAMMITDFSSVAFDMAYMYKPICYYQFDEEEFRIKHFAKGYYDYRNGLGTYASTSDELWNCIEMYINNGMTMLNEHRKKAEDFFVLHDRNNCQRIFEETMKLFQPVR